MPRTLALFLSFVLSLPNPAFALRPLEAKEKVGPQGGLEELNRTIRSGNPAVQTGIPSTRLNSSATGLEERGIAEVELPFRMHVFPATFFVQQWSLFHQQMKDSLHIKLKNKRADKVLEMDPNSSNPKLIFGLLSQLELRPDDVLEITVSGNQPVPVLDGVAESFQYLLGEIGKFEKMAEENWGKIDYEQSAQEAYQTIGASFQEKSATFYPRIQSPTAGLEEDIETYKTKPTAVFAGGKDLKGDPWPFGTVRQLNWVGQGKLLVQDFNSYTEEQNQIRVINVETDPKNQISSVSSSLRFNRFFSEPFFTVVLPPARSPSLRNLLFFSGSRGQAYWSPMQIRKDRIFKGKKLTENIGLPLGATYDDVSKEVLLLADDDEQVVAYTLAGIPSKVQLSRQPAFRYLEQPSSLVFDPVRRWIWLISKRWMTEDFQLEAFRWVPEKSKYLQIGSAKLPYRWGSKSQMAVDPISGDLFITSPFHGNILVVRPRSDPKKKRFLGIENQKKNIIVTDYDLGEDLDIPCPIAFSEDGRIAVGTEGYVVFLQSMSEIVRENRPPPILPAGKPIPRPERPILWGPSAFQLITQSDGNALVLAWDRTRVAVMQISLNLEQLGQMIQGKFVPLINWGYAPKASLVPEDFLVVKEGPWVARIEKHADARESRFLRVIFSSTSGHPVERDFTERELRELGISFDYEDQLWVKGVMEPDGRLRLFLLVLDNKFKNPRIWEGRIGLVEDKVGKKQILQPTDSHQSTLGDNWKERYNGLVLYNGMPFIYRWVAGNEGLEPLPSGFTPVATGLEEFSGKREITTGLEEALGLGHEA